MSRNWWVLAACGLLLGLGLSRSHNGSPPESGSPVKYQTEEDAIKEGERRDLGSATLDGPREVVVDGTATLLLRFTVGRAGMKTGGGIRLATAHGLRADWGGEKLQTTDPAGENHLSFRTSRGSALAWKMYPGIKHELFDRYHPWQKLNEFKLTGPSLAPGDTIEILLSKCRMQVWDEAAFVLRFYVDAYGDDDYLPLRHNPHFRIVAGDPVELNVVAPSDWIAGQPGWVNVWAGDRFGNPSERYRGTIVVQAGGRTMEYTYRAQDRGVRRFENVVLAQPGTYRAQVKEKGGALSGASNPFVVHAAAPRQKLYWGDLHTHTMGSDGRGTPAEMYDFGRRVSAIDFEAVTDHDFTVSDAMWREIRETTNRFYEPGRFVTFVAYEWSGKTPVGGDHNVYTVDPDMPIIRCDSYNDDRNFRYYQGRGGRAKDANELFAILGARFRNENLLVIPHYGGRPGNPAFHNPQLQRQIEVFSDHRRSEDWATRFLAKGYRLGIMASTDNHSSNAGYGVRQVEVDRGQEGPLFSKISPAERGTSLVAVYAEKLTREAVFQALYHRRTYATTGSRIILRFHLDGAPMGSEVRVKRPPRITASAEGTAPIRVIRVVKNGKIVHALEPGSAAARLEYVDSSGDYENRFYYIDLVQEDGEKAISSPIWVN